MTADTKNFRVPLQIAILTLAVCCALAGCGKAASGPSDAEPASLPALIEIPAPTGPEAVLGSSNPEAAAEVLGALKGAGFDIPGVEAHVYSIGDLGASMLALDVDMATAQGGAATEPPDMEKLWPAIVSSPAIKGSNITRFALYLHGSDDKGSYAMTMTMPMSAIQGLADGTLSEADAQAQMLIKTERGAP